MPTYASEHGIGAVLLQEGQGQIQPIAYSSFLPKVPYGLAVWEARLVFASLVEQPARLSAAEAFLASSGAAAT